MAGITELKALVGDNQEALAIVTSIENTMQQNLGKITDLEKFGGELQSKFDEVVLSRDKVKEVVKNELNISEFNADAIRAKLSTFASDDAIAARDKQFNEFKAQASNTIEQLEQKIENSSKIERDMKMQLAISKTDVMAQTKGQHANDMLMGWIGENAGFDETGNIVYKGPSGETLYNKNGDPLTLEDRINEIKGDESRDFVFQSRFLSGGGSPTNRQEQTPSGIKEGGKFTRTGMTFEEKKSYRSKYGNEAYNNLPLV